MASKPGRWCSQGGLQGLFELPENFGSDRSPRHSRKYKESAFFVAKSLRGNFNSSFRCVFHRYSSRARHDIVCTVHLRLVRLDEPRRVSTASLASDFGTLLCFVSICEPGPVFTVFSSRWEEEVS
ncbi:hypothetical protein HYC85_028433 [Camellia sinensis]|uniref:Uncharacterized protein n=1 Tax=Camellia sinensis TaxID=4442 RepID=A0A7J7FVB2_CAMSI|nr:hypothetical protein HYC85_028433 [Camellia sinensis]